MTVAELLENLGYATSSSCRRDAELDREPGFGHVFRRAQKTVGLKAVYLLHQPVTNTVNEAASNSVPVSYVCQAETLADADRIHRLVWNQSVVPFLIVLAPDRVRLYSGFERRLRAKGSAQSTYLAEADLAQAAERLAAVSAKSVDSGRVWDELGAKIRPEGRVEWRLLDDLRKLEGRIDQTGLRDRPLIHALVGKYVYLHYLRERGILSDERLGKWGLSWGEVSGRLVQIRSFETLCGALDEWLNGTVFPIDPSQLKKIGQGTLRYVGGVFAGDDPTSGQLHLDFAPYDFSHIPIETLSVIYEQFLHGTPSDAGGSAGEQKAAYYTPVPVVNFMIDRMEEIRPLRPPMRVLDYSCGSGTFLVQCYRRLIENRIFSNSPKALPRPTELRQLLVDHIFGVDVDADACRVAELALILTLLDYVDPPDLTNTTFKLPSLAARNLIHANAFDDTDTLVSRAKEGGFDWIVGNPPWKDLKKGTTDPIHQPVLEWMQRHKKAKPTGGNQTAEAFAWRAQEFACKDALGGLLMPAMTLFKKESLGFRRHFFSSNAPAYVANFANLAEVLFAGRARVPAAAIVFRPGRELEDTERIPVFSPLVANQEATRPRQVGRREETWAIVVDAGEIRPVEARDIRHGDGPTWKLASWGSPLDKTILWRTSKLSTLKRLIDEYGLAISEGLQLRDKAAGGSEPLEHHPELTNKELLLTKELDQTTPFFLFPENAIRRIGPTDTYVRKGRFRLPESICHAPHIIVSAARNWAVFEDRYLIVPPRQIGIAGQKGDENLLKALALYLNSDFVKYHQFFTTTQQGVKREQGTLDALREIPVPPIFFEHTGIDRWIDLHDRLVAHDRQQHGVGDISQKQALLLELNKLVNGATVPRKAEALRVNEFVHVIFGLRDGKVEERAVRAPGPSELQKYAKNLKAELDAFVGSGANASHAINVWSDARLGPEPA